MINRTNRSQRGNIYITEGTESTVPNDPGIGYLFIDSKRKIICWNDGDAGGFEYATFVDNADVLTSTKTVSNTTTETEAARFSIDGGAMVKGRLFIIRTFGKYSTASSNDGFTYRIKIGDQGFDAATEGTVVGSLSTVQENVTDGPWHTKSTITVASEGQNGEAFTHLEAAFNNNKGDSHEGKKTANTETAEDFVTTIEWNNAKADNSATRGQGYLQQQA